MEDCDLDKAIQLRTNRDIAFSHSNTINNYSLSNGTYEAYQYAFARLSQPELEEVKKILINACDFAAKIYSTELQKL